MKEESSRIIQQDPFELLECMIDLASSLPKIGEIALTQPAAVVPYRQNFFERFKELHAIKFGTAPESHVIYVRMVKERFGFDLLRFYDENQELCESTYSAITAKEPYDHLVLGREQVAAFEQHEKLQAGSTRSIDEAVGHILGIQAVGLFFWNNINPLLETAYSIIEPTTLNAPFLTK